MSESKIVFTDEQKKIIDLVNAGRNVFFTGPAGTGKSVILKEILAQHRLKPKAVCAYTGTAANNIGGQTIHSYFGLRINTLDVDEAVKRIMDNKFTLRKVKELQLLIIDEISFLNVEFFDFLNEVVSKVRKTSHLDPFKGIQLVFSGDFFQLAGISDDGSESKFVYHSKYWKLAVDNVVQLKHVHRQDDEAFINALNEARIGKLSEESKQLFASREVPFVIEEGKELVTIKPTKLFATNRAADDYNMKEYKTLRENYPDEMEKTFEAVDYVCHEAFRATLEAGRFPKTLILCKGCQVICLYNDKIKGIYNGSRGVMTGFNELGQPMCAFANGIHVITRQAMACEVIENGGPKILYSRTQIPLRLGWAFTVHKSQGMSIDLLSVNLKGIFTTAQAYVALSRATKLDSLYIEHWNNGESVKANEEVVEYYENIDDPNYLKNKKQKI